MVTKVKWNSETPATVVLLDPLFDDMGIGKGDELLNQNPEYPVKARVAARNYFEDLIYIRKEDGTRPTMGEINLLVPVFYDAYLAGLENNAFPLIR